MCDICKIVKMQWTFLDLYNKRKDDVDVQGPGCKKYNQWRIKDWNERKKNGRMRFDYRW